MNSTVIITGAAGNLGRAITKRLLDDGHHIHATLGSQDDPGFIEHENLVSQAVNLLDENSAEVFVEKIMEKHDSVHALICIVGGFAQGGIEDADGESIQKMIHLNFESAYFTVRPLIKRSKAIGTPLHIIFIGARPAINPEEGKSLVAYGLSKSLLFKLAEYINMETNATGISASVIVPSTLDTPGTRAAMPNSDPSKWVTTEKVADSVTFLLSDTGKMMRQSVLKIYNKA